MSRITNRVDKLNEIERANDSHVLSLPEEKVAKYSKTTNMNKINEAIISNIELEEIKTDLNEFHEHLRIEGEEDGADEPSMSGLDIVRIEETEASRGGDGTVGGSGGGAGTGRQGRSDFDTDALRRGSTAPPAKCDRNFMRRFMKSRRLHIVIVILVILDSICVSVELIVDLIVTVYNEHKRHHDAMIAAALNNQSSLNNINNPVNNTNDNNSTHHRTTTIVTSSSSLPRPSLSPPPPASLQPPNIPHHTIPSSFSSGSDEYLWSLISDINFRSIDALVTVETFFMYFGLVILSLFVVEILFKIIFIPRELMRSKWGIFDAIVVFTSFILDVILLKDKKILHTVSGLITLFRLWRITRIINGIVMTMEKKSAKKIEKLIKIIETLKTENEQLKEIINEKNLLIESLREMSLRNNNNNSNVATTTLTQNDYG